MQVPVAGTSQYDANRVQYFALWAATSQTHEVDRSFKRYIFLSSIGMAGH